MLTPRDAALLGLVEGLTEFVPVSSTGHLILVGHWLGLAGPGVDAFEIVIQFGALLACVAYYRKIVLETAKGLIEHRPSARRFFLALLSGFVPTAILGFLFHKSVEAHLFGPRPVAAALIVGGAIMIGVEQWRRRRSHGGLASLENVSPQQGFWIGVFQSASLWPGTSRSMSSIVGGQIMGLSTRVACDFSFLLGIPTLGAACLFKLVKSRHVLLAEVGLGPLLVGLLVSFVVGWLVIAIFLRVLRSTGLSPFGVYRIIVGSVILIWLGRAMG